MSGLFTTVLRAAKRSVATLRTFERNTGRVQRRPAPTARPIAGVDIEYDPVLDGDPNPGEVVWTWVPFEDDPTLGKDRPVAIIGRRGDGLVGAALTSQRPKRDRQAVEVGSGDWDSERRISYALVGRLLDIDPDAVRREGAILNRRRFDQVVEAASRIHGRNGTSRRP